MRVDVQIALAMSRKVDYCAFGPCVIENRPSAGLPDGDNDGIPDDADNCPSIANSDQADHDHDLIGDVCDPLSV